MPKDKKTVKKTNKANIQKRAEVYPSSSDSMKMVWIFDSVDHDGPYSFEPSRDDFNAVDIFKYVIDYSSRNWHEIRQDTHDGKGKSKHHHLSEPDKKCSQKARERMKALKIDDDEKDMLFSMRVDNLKRIIGLKDGEKFIVKWYDPRHEFYPADD